jgi:2-polyprenyl-3-methyl-5-hydroxy-6-metoxy-1,4-benzoquinol methylase
VRPLSSLLKIVKAGWGHRAPLSDASSAFPQPIDTEALWKNGDYFWAAVDAQPDQVRLALYERYPLIPRAYCDLYFGNILTGHRLNPLAPLYIESELGAPARQVALLDELESAGIRIDGRRCLDVGCSNGSLLLAARGRGAARCVGVDVSEARINSARRLCEGADVELLVHDLVDTGLPESCGPFDVILCTDVLEHVTSIPAILGAMARHLARTDDARIFVTVYNHLNPVCVASEPHYGVPGLVLIDRDSAAEIWNAVRGQLKSAVDYEVEGWPDYPALADDARRSGLRITPHLDRAGLLANRHAFWSGYAQRFDELERTTSARLEELDLSVAHRTRLRDAIHRYCRDAVAAHRAFEAGLSRMSDDDVVLFYLKYYAQPIRAFLSHA